MVIDGVSEANEVNEANDVISITSVGGASGGAANAGELERLRAFVDAIDTDLIALLARRFEVTRQIGAVKVASGLPPRDHVRERSQLERLMAQARALGIDDTLVRGIFTEIFATVVADHRGIVGETARRERPQRDNLDW